jgi:hypothetical protein
MRYNQIAKIANLLQFIGFKNDTTIDEEYNIIDGEYNHTFFSFVRQNNIGEEKYWIEYNNFTECLTMYNFNTILENDDDDDIPILVNINSLNSLKTFETECLKFLKTKYKSEIRQNKIKNLLKNI